MQETPSIGRPSVLRYINAINTLRVLRQGESCSRADLSRALGLSAPTITNVVKDLLAAGLVLPMGEGKPKGGRPPDMIRFNAAHGCMAGVQITATLVRLVLTDLDGQLLGRQEVKLQRGHKTPEGVCSVIQAGVRDLLKQSRQALRQLLMLVVAAPAITDVENGVVLSISTLEGWRSVPLGSMLGKLFRCRIIIENDVNLAAQGEQFRGAARAEESFVYVDIGTNVGAGIVLQGQIHHGAQWCAGEIGYLRLPQLSRRLPAIHEFGELEGLITESGILHEWARENADTTAPGRRGQLSATDILQLAEAANPTAVAIVGSRAQMVADILINLSLILNPDLILLGGTVGSHPAMIAATQQQLQRSEFAVTKVAAGLLGGDAVLWGAISLGMGSLTSVLIPEVSA